MAPNDKTAQETNFAEFLNKTVQETKETIKMLKEAEEKFKTILPSPFGSIQAINTTDDLFFKIEALSTPSKPATAHQKPSLSSVKEALAVYKTLSVQEWKKYFNLLDTKKLSQDQTEQLRTYIIKRAEKEPYLRRLVRETIQHGKPITFSSTPEDWEELKKRNFAGDANFSTRHIRLLPEEISTSSVFHEILHIGQGDDNVDKENNNYYSRALIQKQRKFIEAEARSIDYLCHDKRSTYFFNQLLIRNENELYENQQDIPAGLTNEEKRLWIHTQAVNRTIGASIHILMQPKGEKTQQAAAAYGIELMDIDLERVNYWKEFYNNNHKEWICKDYANQVTGNEALINTEREQFVYNYITDRYPGLKGKDFFVTGLTDEEQKSWDIRKSWENYGQLTDEQIRADNLLNDYGSRYPYADENGNICLRYNFSETAYDENQKQPSKSLDLNVTFTEEEMNYLAKIREARDKAIKTDIPMPVSLKKLIETQEKTLQYNSRDKEVAAFNELAASRKKLFENRNQQSYQTTALNFWRGINSAAYEHYKESFVVAAKPLFENDKEASAVENKNQQSNLAATLNAAQEHKENDNTSSTASRESGKER